MEKRVELVFDCHNFFKEKKVKLVTTKFVDYAIVWWDQIMINISRQKECPINTLEEMEAIIWKYFVPSSYYKELPVITRPYTRV